MLYWIKDKLGMLALEREYMELRRQLQNHRDFVYSKVEELKAYTRVDADVGVRGNNTLSLQCLEDGIDNCLACDPSQAKIDIEDIIDGIEYDLSGDFRERVVMNRLLELAQFIHTHLVEKK